MSYIDPMSGKRWHRKGFTGHRVNPPAQLRHDYPPEMTNHERMIYRKEQREARKKAEQEAKK